MKHNYCNISLCVHNVDMLLIDAVYCHTVIDNLPSTLGIFKIFFVTARFNHETHQVEV